MSILCSRLSGKVDYSMIGHSTVTDVIIVTLSKLFFALLYAVCSAEE